MLMLYQKASHEGPRELWIESDSEFQIDLVEYRTRLIVHFTLTLTIASGTYLKGFPRLG
jgi:hypothetical protein